MSTTEYVRVKNRGKERVPLYAENGDSVFVPGRATITVERRFVDFQLPPFPLAIVGDVQRSVSTHGPVLASATAKEINALRNAPASPVEKATAANPVVAEPVPAPAPSPTADPSLALLLRSPARSPDLHSPARPYDSSQSENE